MRVISLLTDFGLEDAYVGVMKGVVLGINPNVQLVDLTHAIAPQDVQRAALILRSAVSYFPPGTVHVAVVDPGVGSARRALLMRTPKAFLIGPDNGVLSLAAQQLRPFTAYAIENDKFFHHPVSQTFHGRDIFAPVAAHLSAGVAADAFGPTINSIVELDLPAPVTEADGVRGEVVYVDRFGNLVTNIDTAALTVFHGRALSVSIGARVIAGPATAYTAVAAGTPVALIGSWSMLEIAVRDGHAARTLGAGPGTAVRIDARDSRG